MKEQIRQLIAGHLMRKSRLKLQLRNLSITNELTEELQNSILDDLAILEDTLQKLESFYKSL
jgi:hypothetical protein